MKESTITYCEKDWKNIHIWNPVGVFHDDKGEFIVHKCMQCHKYKKERVVYVEGDE